MKKWQFQWFHGSLPNWFRPMLFLFPGTTKVKSKFWHIGHLMFGYNIPGPVDPVQYIARAPQAGTDADFCPCASCEQYRDWLISMYGKEVNVAHPQGGNTDGMSV